MENDTAAVPSLLPDGLADAICADRVSYALPPRLPDLAERVLHAALALLFPHFTREAGCRSGEVEADAQTLADLLDGALTLPGVETSRRGHLVTNLLAGLPDIRASLLLDARATADGDPAASGIDEVILAYPGFFATAVHRIAHRLHLDGAPLLPRVLGELAHRVTGIDIHPGARIGASFAIDHGTGVVVGETCWIGDRVRLYQGVTLGALVVEKTVQDKRHPTVEDDVIIYSGSTILGGDTVIGAGSRIGGNVWLTRSLPPGSSVATSAGIARRRTPKGAGAESREESDGSLEFHL